MKKTTQISKIFIALAMVMFFVACKKEIDRPQTYAKEIVNSLGAKKKIPPIKIYYPMPDSATIK